MLPRRSHLQKLQEKSKSRHDLSWASKKITDKLAEDYEVRIMAEILRADGIKEKRAYHKKTGFDAVECIAIKEEKRINYAKIAEASQRASIDKPALPELPLIRPPATYTNTPSYYGVFDEMMADQTAEEISYRRFR